jgi:phage baseplate assembly protein gpV
VPGSLLDSFEIKVDGSALASYDRIVGISIRAGLDTSAHARIEIDADDLDSTTFGVGKALVVEVGPAGSSSLTQVFAGTILAVGCELSMGRTQFAVDAYDDSYKLGRETVVATHLNVTFGDVVSTMASAAGLTADVQGLPSTQFESVQQFGTPHQFLHRLVWASGCTWRVEGSTLLVRPRTAGAAPLTLTAGENLMSFRVRYSASENVEGVKVRGWDPVQQAAVVGVASAPTTDATASIVGTGSAEAKTGVAWTRTPVDQSDAEALATALRQWMDDSRVLGRGQTLCAPSMIPGSKVTIDGMGALFNGDYRVAEVEHVFQPTRAFVTRFTVGAPEPTSIVDLLGPGTPSSSGNFLGGVTVGIVTNLDDPEGKKRVKLKLPYLTDQEETGWARVMQFGAGNGRGWWVHPEVDDEVIVAFEHGDPRLPIVLGGVWSGTNAWPTLAVVDQGRLTARSFTSATGHVLNFDDGDTPLIEVKHASTNAHVVLHKDNGILIEAPDQDIAIKNGKGSLLIAKNGDITIKGANVTIEAQQKVTIKATSDAAIDGLNVKVTAQAGLEAKGSATAKLEGGTMTEVKGGMVKIN